MGRKHDRETILAEALALAREDGLHALTFGRVASRVGIPDRTVVYYFPTKTELLAAVLGRGSEELQELLARAIRAPAKSPVALARKAWPVISSPGALPSFRLLVDAVALALHDAAAAAVVRALFHAWTTALEPLFEGTPASRRADAEAAVALLDGLLVLRFSAGREASARAARALLGAGRG